MMDQRASTVAQNKSIKGISNSPQTQKTAQLQVIMNGSTPIQKAAEEEEVQMKAAPVQKKEHNTGLPDNLKSGVEKLSGEYLDDVQVHRNSDQPAQMQQSDQLNSLLIPI